jgi:hypothetical protein
MSNSKTYEIPAGTVPSLSGNVAIAVVPVNPETGDPILGGGGGGGGGDTSNITTVGTTAPTKAAYIAVKNGSVTGVPSLGAQADSASLAVSLSTESKALLTAIEAAQYKVPAAVTAAKFNLTSTASTPLALNANRLTVTIDNPGGVLVWYSFTGTAAATIGDSMPLYPQTRVTHDVSEIGTGALSMVAAANTSVRVMQTTR